VLSLFKNLAKAAPPICARHVCKVVWTCLSLLLVAGVGWVDPVHGTSPTATSVTVYHVASGHVPGTYSQLSLALDAARALRQQHPSAAFRIEVAPGDYYEETSLHIGPELSGRAHAPTEIVGIAGGPMPRILAGRRLTLQWRPYRDGIQQATVTGTGFDQLYVDGHRQIRARYPNIGASGDATDGYAANAISPERMARWKNPAGGVLHALHEKRWGGMQIPILGKDSAGRLLLGPAVGNNRPSAPSQNYRYVENIFEELDAPGEWFFDAARSTLYFLPPPGVDLAKARIDVSGPARLFDLEGDRDAPVRFVRIAGLKIEHTSYSFLRNTEPLLRSDWEVAREGAVYLERTEDVSIDDNEFDELGGNAVFVSGYNRRVSVAGNHIHDIGAGGINFVGRPDAVRSPAYRYEDSIPYQSLDLRAGPKSDDYPAESEARNNLIHDIGLVEKQVAGVELSMSMDITVSHNSIYQVPRAGINVGDGTWGGHLIEYNDVFDTVLETGDHGAFNSWGRDRYWSSDRDAMDRMNVTHPGLWKLDVIKPITLRHNRFRCDRGWDIDLDDGSSNYRIYDNVLLSGGLKFREGFDREAWNNVLVNNSFHPHVWFAHSGDRFEHNVVMAAYQPVLMQHWDATIDYNLFPSGHALDAARKLGLDRHSRAGNPGFMDAASGDFRVANSSPARLTGFENFPTDNFGVTSVALRALARTPKIPELATQTGRPVDTVYSLLGATFKSVTTLGEQSAAGLADTKGVLVLTVASNSVAEKSGLRANDVIVEAPSDEMKSAPEPVDNAIDLLRLWSARAWRGSITLTIVRNQAQRSVVLRAGQD
jgi:hypothetical protein